MDYQNEMHLILFFFDFCIYSALIALVDQSFNSASLIYLTKLITRYVLDEATRPQTHFTFIRKG